MIIIELLVKELVPQKFIHKKLERRNYQTFVL